ncbi:hypothetical protein D3H55_21480 [Bacillus salacetis]|uniref:Uncharacterized protein n=1 Tax=Bacillus salacetis TaxID=2315464 RepID=A0A3A1QN90_9BACI|nr:hypothetical protein [Bacillus salacetis]RIW28549.1 hypothetical protein D3H55_21480 [Bacillus salacetis]
MEATQEQPFKKTDYLLLFTVLTISLALIYSFLRYNRRKKDNKDTEQVVNQGHNDDLLVLDNIKLINENKIRQLLIDWQSNLEEVQKKRDSETIYEWFLRINGPLEVLPIYDKVRYGQQEYTQSEYLLISSKLNRDK